MTQLKNFAATSSNEPIVLVCAADNNYAMPLAVTIRSVVENIGSGRKLLLFIIDGGIEERNQQKILNSVDSDIVKVTWLKPLQSLLDGVEDSRYYYTKAIYYRLCIPDLLMQYKKAIYLDSDLLVLEDIGKLWDYELGNSYILAAKDIYPSIIGSPGFIEFLQTRDSASHKVFNTGVLVINLEKWRNDKIAAETVKVILQKKLLDQEGLNIILENKWQEIDSRWNRTSGIYEYDSWKNSSFSEDEFNNLVNNPYIIHFTSAAKPWNSIDRCPEQSLFYHYLDLTAYSGWRFTQWKRIMGRLSKEVKQIRKRFAPAN